jgi:hypothetical protein
MPLISSEQRIHSNLPKASFDLKRWVKEKSKAGKSLFKSTGQLLPVPEESVLMSVPKKA